MDIQQKSVTEYIPGIEYDENGLPAGYSIQEVFDELDNNLIAQFGQEGRKIVNESRDEWNKKYPWHFEKL